MSMDTNVKQKRRILDEEEYMSTLTSIVQRDYFPDLPSLQKQAAVFDRREANDFKGAVAVRRAARRLQDHQDAIDEEERNLEIELEGGIRIKKRRLDRESVTGFHARVTSDDNHEFHEKSKQELTEKLIRIEEVYRNPHQNLMNGERNGNESPLLASDAFNAPWHRIEAPKNPEFDNGLFFPPRLPSKPIENSLLLTSESEQSLMPPPERRIPKEELVEYIPKTKLEIRIQPAQTRFPTSITLVQPKPMPLTDETDYSTEASTDLDDPTLQLSRERSAYASQKVQELESLVTMTPLILPQASPLTTWGNVNSTPLVLTRAFSMQDENPREKASKVVEKNLARKRNSCQASKTSFNRLSNLTPAARSLLQKTMPQVSSVRSSSAFSQALKNSYTPQSRNSSNVTEGRATPRKKVHGEGTSLGQDMTSKNLTDGLLN